MKAGIRTSSKGQSKGIDKNQQNDENTLKKVEIKFISDIVGIDSSQSQKFSWFYDMLEALILPINYKKYLNSQRDKIIYYNIEKQEEQYVHPYINNIKIIFYQTLANDKAVYTFKDKQRKLLPFVQQKMIRQSIGLPSKRKQAEKINLKKDETGRLVFNKMERLTPDFKPLIISRSYVVKMLVQKLFTKRQLFGKGKRANAYANILNQYRKKMKQNVDEIQQTQIESQEKLALYQKIFQQAGYFYVIQFGNLVNIPPSILVSKEYIQSTPENILKNLFLLNIDKDNIQLYWFGRIMDCLPLPPNWTKKKGATFDTYFYQPQKFLFDMHPSYIYIMYQMNQFRSKFQKMQWMIQNYYLSMRTLTFYDFFQRQYTVDMYGYKQRAERNNIKSSSSKQRNKNKALQKANQSSDWMILQGLKNVVLQRENLMLLQHIQIFWQSLDYKYEPFFPAVSPFGQVIWSSSTNNKAITFNPYKSALSRIIQQQTKIVPKLTQNILRQRFKPLLQDKQQHKAEQKQLKKADSKQQQKVGLNQQNKTEQKQQNKQVQQPDFLFNFQKLQKQAYDFTTYYLNHLHKPVPFPYQIKQQLPLLNQNNFYQQLFVCPFQLDLNIVPQGQKIPFWLQKIKAKQFYDQALNLLLVNPQDFLIIKQKVSDYILDMVGFHQPHTFQQTQKKIKRLATPQQLLRFLAYIVDLDARQQRKKQYLQSQIVQDNDSDIFGSQLSQFQPQQIDQSQQQRPKTQQPQEQQQQTIKQPQVVEQSQSQPQPLIQIIKIIEQPQEPVYVPPQQDYSFLDYQHFRSKMYNKNYKIQKMTQQQLQSQLKKIIKIKIKKNKYKKHEKITQQLKFTNNVLKNNIFQKNRYHNQELHKIKKNLIITNLSQSKIPYKFNTKVPYKQYQIQKGRCLTQYNYQQHSDYSQFRSQISQYQNDQIDYLINQIRKKKYLQAKIKTQSQRYSEHQQTQDTIELDPIYQIKPQIKFDPVLRHIKSVSQELNQFRNTFNSTNIRHKSLKDSKLELNKVKSNKKLGIAGIETKGIQTNYSSLPTSTKDNFVKKMERSSQPDILRKSLSKKQSFSSSLSKFQTVQKPFYRVCLQHTASHFLEKQAFLRKGDIVTMQARKTLLSKGRGLQTYISKFY